MLKGRFPWVNSQKHPSPSPPNADRQGGDNNGAAEEGALLVTEG